LHKISFFAQRHTNFRCCSRSCYRCWKAMHNMTVCEMYVLCSFSKCVLYIQHTYKQAHKRTVHKHTELCTSECQTVWHIRYIGNVHYPQAHAHCNFMCDIILWRSSHGWVDKGLPHTLVARVRILSYPIRFCFASPRWRLTTPKRTLPI